MTTAQRTIDDIGFSTISPRFAIDLHYLPPELRKAGQAARDAWQAASDALATYRSFADPALDRQAQRSDEAGAIAVAPAPGSAYRDPGTPAQDRLAKQRATARREAIARRAVFAEAHQQYAQAATEWLSTHPRGGPASDELAAALTPLLELAQRADVEATLADWITATMSGSSPAPSRPAGAANGPATIGLRHAISSVTSAQ